MLGVSEEYTEQAFFVEGHRGPLPSYGHRLFTWSSLFAPQDSAVSAPLSTWHGRLRTPETVSVLLLLLDRLQKDLVSKNVRASGPVLK